MICGVSGDDCALQFLLFGVQVATVKAGGYARLAWS